MWQHMFSMPVMRTVWRREQKKTLIIYSDIARLSFFNEDRQKNIHHDIYSKNSQAQYVF